jgi:hypothetical protein
MQIIPPVLLGPCWPQRTLLWGEIFRVRGRLQPPNGEKTLSFWLFSLKN